MKYIKSPFYLYPCVLILLAACNVPRRTTVQNEQALPATFNGHADTMTAADLPIQRFFPDSNLVRLIDIAVHNNPDMNIALQRVMAAKANIRYAQAALTPQLSIAASGGVERYGDYTMNGVGNFDTNLSGNISKDQHIPRPTTDVFLGLRSSWEIDVWGKLKQRKKAAVAHYFATEKGRQWVTTQLVATVAGLYYELLAQDDNMSIIGRNIQLQEKAYEMVQAQKEGGRATELAVQQFKGQLLHTKSFEFEIKQNITRIETQLNTLLGRFPQPVTRSRSILAQQMPQQLQAGVPSGLLARRSDIQQAEWELNASRANVEAARKAFLPSFTITPYAGVNAFTVSLLFKPGSLVFGLLGGLTAPIINRRQLKADYGVANAQQAGALYTYQKNILQAVSEVYTELQAVDNYRHLFELKEDEARALANAVTNANDLYATGAANYLEVVTAQKGLLDAELE
ncbi:MAG TPA: efflux transporter outer membrane subunit, partial [Puia sp.]|nr:efflux transporter outer membrane subunit [Puia sp.]